MRIGLTCSTIEPALTHGKIDGIGMYTKALLHAYEQYNLDVTPLSYPSLKKWIKSSGIPKGKIFPLPFTAATFTSLLSPLLYKNMHKQLDLLHVTDHMIPRVKQLPVIATIHDALMFSHPEWYPSKLRGIKNKLRKETMRWASHFITVSHAMVHELVEYLDIKEENISVVHNGISENWQQRLSSEEKMRILNQLHLPEKFILFTGTLQPKKNVPRLIEAYLSLPKDIQHEFPLVIAGKAGWNTEESLAAIKKLKAEKAGFWLNYVSDQQIRALYQSASLYVFPSLHEGFGLPLLEAFASGAPVIASNIPALSEVANGAAFLTNPQSISDIKEAMQNVLTSTSLQESLIKNGHSRVKHFTLDQCAKNTLKVYEKIA